MRIAQVALYAALYGIVGFERSTPPPADPHEVEIVGLDYTFQIPAKVTGGRTTFRFVNRGKVAHELNINQLKKGASVQEFLDSLRANKPTVALRDGPVGVLFAEAGKRASAGLSVDLLPGRNYVVICINRDNPKAQRHVEMGMYSVIAPGPTAAQSPIAARVDTIVGTDYAFQYPRTLAPGRHHIAFANRGTVRHEVFFSLLKKGVTVEQTLALEKAGGDVRTLLDEDIGVLPAPVGMPVLGRLEIDMLPGREYAIVCTFSNDDKSPPHMALGMFGSIRVAEK
jgi:hypothetical protein